MINHKVFEKVIPLETRNMILREIRLEDQDKVFELQSSEKVKRFLGYKKENTLENAVKYIDKLHHFYKKKWAMPWVATLKGSDELIGICTFNAVDVTNHRAEIDGVLFERYWRTGLAIEGFLALLKFGFETMNLHTISAKTMPENKSTISLLEKFGFEREGHIRDRVFINGEYKDLYLYSILEGNQTLDKLLEKHLTEYKEISK
ncbi:GNAT family protein [Bernardetia sp. ABR2-2B]|uniref:GNAT family N-acetyltransferase n=1 Tax=Bernardetia sp. ABR2-2B TaxID=3127472 RepID=UPI0030CC354A